MLNTNEKEGLLHYLEFLMINSIIEPVSKHINDPDVIQFLYDQTYAVLNQLEQDIYDYNVMKKLDPSKRQK